MSRFKRIAISLSLLTFAGIAVYFIKEYYDFKIREKMYDKLIKESAKRHNIAPSLIKAVIRQESKFKANVRGSHGEYGLMQITKGAADDWLTETRNRKFDNYEQLFIPALNIEIGTWYLSKAYRKFSEYKNVYALSLAQYNAGPGAVIKNKWIPSDKNGEVLDLISYPTTTAYIRYILEYEQAYKNGGFNHD